MESETSYPFPVVCGCFHLAQLFSLLFLYFCDKGGERQCQPWSCCLVTWHHGSFPACSVVLQHITCSSCCSQLLSLILSQKHLMSENRLCSLLIFPRYSSSEGQVPTPAFHWLACNYFSNVYLRLSSPMLQLCPLPSSQLTQLVF